MKTLGLILTIFIASAFTPSSEVSEELKFRMFCAACGKPFSTAHDFAVVKVKNATTGEIKEICTTSNLLMGAIYRETGDLYNGIDCNKYPKRYFEFSNDSALWNIGFNAYSAEELSAYSKTINVDSIVSEVKKGAMRSMNFEKEEQKKYFAHLMFNHGVVITSGCFGTTLSYFRK